MIDIQKLDKNRLSDYITSDTYQKAPVVAITEHRAKSHLLNPRAKDNDILLFLAYEDTKLVGYLGVLPDDIQLADHTFVHVGWMSCLWVDPDHRGKKIAQQLMNACFEAWNHRVILTEFTSAAGALYLKSGLFSEFMKLNGQRWYMRADLKTLLPSKRSFFSTIRPGLKIVDTIVNAAIDGLRLLQKPVLRDYQILYTDTVSPEMSSWLHFVDRKEVFCRKTEDLNWILKNPWILEGSEKNKRYHFSSVEKKFDARAIEVRTSFGDIVAFLIFTNRNGHLKLPYIFYHVQADAVLEVIRYLVQIFKIHTCTIYNERFLHDIAKKRPLPGFHKNVCRTYLIAKNLVDIPVNSVIQDGDGDCAFT
ncbi:MAG: GNAT family N-acetyltransferase [Saprospiraceae bacterium]|nr:GNAT family N-acetyltransferase [Saprospiraceae bacterium]MBK8668239.1 GNAT family N-acetyltransferase [Saprospiraceae bacterium]